MKPALMIIIVILWSSLLIYSASAFNLSDTLIFSAREDVTSFVLPGFTDIHQHCTGGSLAPGVYRFLYDCRKLCLEDVNCIGISAYLPNGQWCVPKNSSCNLLREYHTKWSFLKKGGIEGFSTLAPLTQEPAFFTDRQVLPGQETLTSKSPPPAPSPRTTLLSQIVLSSTPVHSTVSSSPSKTPTSSTLGKNNVTKMPCNTTYTYEYGDYQPECEQEPATERAVTTPASHPSAATLDYSDFYHDSSTGPVNDTALVYSYYYEPH